MTTLSRFYTSNEFHPKLYIFRNKYILVGSANLTGQAISSNQEIVVGLSPDDARFDELTQLFFDYWDEAKVLTNESILIYKTIYEKYDATQLVYDIEKNVINNLGNINFSNIDRAKKKATKEELYLDNYRKSYQESVTAYRKIQEIYIQKPRKVSENQIPLRLEIDSFFSFVRDRYATKAIWKEQSLGWDEAKQNLLISLIDEWLITYWGHFEKNIVKHNYPQIKEIFSSPESIENSSTKEILDGLSVLHSFHDRLRFFPGGLDSLKAQFLESNGITQTKKSLKYLLFGKGDLVQRMSDVLFDDVYKLHQFGTANVQELVGWISPENLPVINGRTTKILRYFGFNVRQLD